MIVGRHLPDGEQGGRVEAITLAVAIVVLADADLTIGGDFGGTDIGTDLIPLTGDTQVERLDVKEEAVDELGGNRVGRTGFG